MILELSQPLPLDTPKGPALAYLVIDHGTDSNLIWVCFIKETGECWCFDNSVIRLDKNITSGVRTGESGTSTTPDRMASLAEKLNEKHTENKPRVDARKARLIRFLKYHGPATIKEIEQTGIPRELIGEILSDELLFASSIDGLWSLIPEGGWIE
jgi:hypothetical protein